MSYILDALRKLEEQENGPGGKGKRLSGGGRQQQKKPSRRGGLYLFAAALIIVGVGFLVFNGGDGDGAPAGTVSPARPEGPGAEGNRSLPAAAAETMVREGKPLERGVPQAAPARASGGNGQGRIPAAPSPGGETAPVTAAAEASKPPVKRAAAELSFEDVFGDLVPAVEAGKSEEVIAAEGQFDDPPGENRPPERPEPGRLYDFEELPEAVREGIGELEITGHIYSEDASFRLLMIGDGVRREGDAITPGLVLKEITENGAHFAYRGYLFLVTAF